MLRSNNRNQSQPPPSEKRLHIHIRVMASQVCPFDDGLDNLQEVYLLACLIETLIVEHLHFLSVNLPWLAQSLPGHRS